MTNFNDLKRKGVISRGPKPKETPKSNSEKYRIRAEARRRASLVLQYNHREEYDRLVEQEFTAMTNVS